MSVVGIGIDLVDGDRWARMMARHRERFVARCFRSPGPGDDDIELAGRWAAKEAFLKALGSDVKGVPYRDVEISRTAAGLPVLTPHGTARRALDATGALKVHLAIAHGPELTVATVILEK